MLVDGVDLSTVRLDSYRTQLGVVLQETFLFDGTIWENVAFARPHATDTSKSWKLAVSRAWTNSPKRSRRSTRPSSANAA